MKEYKVGQILFLIGTKTTKVMPIQIIEEVVRTTIDGKEKTYTVQLPDQKKTKVDIKEIKGKIFNSDKAVRDYMIKNARKAIELMIEDAINISNMCFVVKEENYQSIDNDVSEVNDEENVQQIEDNGIIKVDLGGGQIANVTTSDLDQLKNNIPVGAK